MTGQLSISYQFCGRKRDADVDGIFRQNVRVLIQLLFSDLNYVSHMVCICVYHVFTVTYIYMTMHPYVNAVQITKHTMHVFSGSVDAPELCGIFSKFPKCVHIANISRVINNLSNIGNIVGAMRQEKNRSVTCKKIHRHWNR